MGVADNKSLNKLIIANYIKTTREINGMKQQRTTEKKLLKGGDI